MGREEAEKTAEKSLKERRRQIRNSFLLPDASLPMAYKREAPPTLGKRIDGAKVSTCYKRLK